MYGDQFGEFVCGYWGLKGYGNQLNYPQTHSAIHLLNNWVKNFRPMDFDLK